MPECINKEELRSKLMEIVENKCIDNLPIADVAPVKHGKWFDVGSLSCRCSACGCKHIKESNFCPNCGAKMDFE